MAASLSVSLCGQHYAKVTAPLGSGALPAGDELCYYCEQRLEVIAKE